MQEKFPPSVAEDAPGYAFGETFTGSHLKDLVFKWEPASPPRSHKTYRWVQQDQAADGGRPLGDSRPGVLTVLEL